MQKEKRPQYPFTGFVAVLLPYNCQRWAFIIIILTPNHSTLDYSCNLLQHSDRSITDICHSAGFGSLRTFNRTFLNTYKMSPRDYRKMICEV